MRVRPDTRKQKKEKHKDIIRAMEKERKFGEGEPFGANWHWNHVPYDGRWGNDENMVKG